MDSELIRNHILSQGISGPQSRTTCPSCGPERKKKKERSLAVKLDGDEAVYHCHHCEESGVVKIYEWEHGFEMKTEEPVHQPVHHDPPESDLSEAQYAWLESRGISRETVDQCGIVSQEMYIR